MSQAVPFVVFYALVAFVGLGTMTWTRPRAPSREGARAAMEAALRGANLQAARVLPLIGLSLAALGVLAACAVLGAGALVPLNAAAPFAIAALLGGASWLAGRVALETACEQIGHEEAAGSFERLVRSVLGRILVPHALGALLGLLPNLLPLNPALAPVARGAAAFLLVFAACSSSNLESIALRPQLLGRSFVSLAAATCFGFLRPLRTSLLGATASLLVHSELAALLGSGSSAERNWGTYLLSVECVATLAVGLGISAVRRESTETKELAFARGTLIALGLFGAGCWLVRGSGHAGALPMEWPIWTLGTLVLVVTAVILPLFFSSSPRLLSLLQPILVLGAWLLVDLVPHAAGVKTPGFTRHMMLTVSGGLLPFALAWQSVFESSEGSGHLAALIFEPGASPSLRDDSVARDGRTSVAALLVALLLGLGMPLSSPLVDSELLAPAALLGAALLALSLLAHVEQLARNERQCEAALQDEAARSPSGAPAFSRALELGVANARGALLGPLCFVGLAISVSLICRWLQASPFGAPRLGIFLGALCTAALCLGLTAATRARGREALGPLAFSLALLGAIALAVVPGVY